MISELRHDNSILQTSVKRKLEVERLNDSVKQNFNPKISSFHNVAADAISNLIQLNLDQSQRLNLFIGENFGSTADFSKFKSYLNFC